MDSSRQTSCRTAALNEHYTMELWRVRTGSKWRLGRSSQLRVQGLGVEPAVAVASPAGAVLARALVVAGTEARPAGGVLGGGKDAHVRAELGEEDLGGALVHAADGVEPRELLSEGRQRGVDLGADGLDSLVQVVEVGEELAHEEGVMGAEVATEVSLITRVLEHLVQAVGVTGPFLNAEFPIAGEVAKLVDRRGRDEGARILPSVGEAPGALRDRPGRPCRPADAVLSYGRFGPI
jgi:hypothetical protein